MRITRYRRDVNNQIITQRVVSLDKAIADMQVETKAKPISTMRNMLWHALPDAKYDFIKKIPIFVFGAEYVNKGGEQRLTTYNGLITLQVNNLADHNEAVEVRDRVAHLPQTLLCFIGSSGKSVKIIVPFTLLDGSLPENDEDIQYFHAQAYQDAVNWYTPQLKRDIELRKPEVNTGVRLTYDPTLYYNPQAVAIRIDQPHTMPGETTYLQAKSKSINPLERLLPGYERQYIISNLFETCLYNAYDQIEGPITDEELQPFFTHLAENCNRSGIPQEDAIRFTLGKWELRNYELLARNTFKNAYELTKIFGKKPCFPYTMSLMEKLKEFMNRRYELRRNVIKGLVEYHERRSYNYDFLPLDKEAMNSITMDALNEGIQSWDADTKRFFESNRIPIYHPLEDYLWKLPKWDGKDYIRQLAQRITCDNPRWPDLFYRWFLSMVSHWKDKNKSQANSAVPLLVGDQGCGKSTFCLHILPPELRDYYTDSIDFSNRRRVEIALNRYALINMDEFDSISPSYQGFMKHIIQKAVVQTLLPHKSTTQKLRRHASFIATSNNFDLLTDPTGSRRFICIEVIGVIDYQQHINYNQLYAQALYALQHRERHWFTHEEEAYITACNQKFQHVIPEEETVHSYFRAPFTDEKYEELTCTEILGRISKRNPNFKCSRTKVPQVGKVLKNKFESRRAHRGWIYKVVEIIEH